MQSGVREHKVSLIKAKMYQFPLNDSHPVDLFDKNQSWFVAPLRHTIK